jgi:opacity protein-like surface antigen
MKRFILLFAALLVASAHSSAQFKQGDVELSFSGSLGSLSNSSNTSGYKYSESRNVAILSVVPGYYIIDGLSLEAELNYNRHS